jgi:hypothetical protein
MPDEFADNHATELEICMRQFSSDAGQVAKIESPRATPTSAPTPCSTANTSSSSNAKPRNEDRC